MCFASSSIFSRHKGGARWPLPRRSIAVMCGLPAMISKELASLFTDLVIEKQIPLLALRASIFTDLVIEKQKQIPPMTLRAGL